jgi:hypothetical protein
MNRGILLGGVVLLLLAGAYWMALRTAIRARVAVDTGGSAVGFREPEILLNGVEVREIRKGGRSDRILARQATYKVLTKDLSAERVTFETKNGQGTVVVEAPQASWHMQEERLDLPQGGTARNGSGWNAEVPDARIDLREQVLTANRATLVLPGIRIAGSGLVWRWKDGTMELSSPDSRVLPGPLRRETGMEERP